MKLMQYYNKKIALWIFFYFSQNFVFIFIKLSFFVIDFYNNF